MNQIHNENGKGQITTFLRCNSKKERKMELWDIHTKTVILTGSQNIADIKHRDVKMETIRTSLRQNGYFCNSIKRNSLKELDRARRTSKRC